MVWKKAIVEDNNFEKTPVAGIVEEYFVRRSSDREKFGTESLEVKLSTVDGDTLEPLGRERTVFLSMSVKGWSSKDGAITIPSYAEVSGLLRSARNQGCELEFDMEDADENPAGVAFEVYEMKFTPDILGAFLRLGVRESKKKNAKEGEQQTFKNYTVEEFELHGIPVQVPVKKSEPRKAARAEVVARPQVPRGRSKPATAGVSLPDASELDYEGKKAFSAYLEYLSNEVSRVLTAKKIVSNLNDFTFKDEGVKAYVTANATTLIAECQEAGELVDAPEGEGKYLFMGKPEE